ncbi:uncharacterized protein LOC101756200 [Setaria italica]|uniref:uncharacterized protein LOC101756200 n=2 Tax=Setaria TaxID=4554 RepID=UPI000BE5D705|nr:uncharacterized protein LOC101756200 [Setaria italica]
MYTHSQSRGAVSQTLIIVDFLHLQVVCTSQGMPGNDKIHLTFLEAFRHSQIYNSCCNGLMNTGAKNKSSQATPVQIRHDKFDDLWL